MEITRHGHAALLVDTGKHRVLLDPGSFSGSWKEATGLSAVAVTHAHADHLDADGVADLVGAQPEVRVVCETEVLAPLGAVGVTARAVAAGEVVDLGGGDALEVVGGTHMTIHEDLGRSGNVGFVLRTATGRALFHPGDDISTVPDGVDVLALPLSAPWGSLADTVEFLRSVRPQVVVPVHDALLSDLGRSIFLARITALGPDGVTVVDPSIGEPHDA